MEEGHCDLPFCFWKPEMNSERLPPYTGRKETYLSLEMGNWGQKKALQIDFVKITFIFL